VRWYAHILSAAALAPLVFPGDGQALAAALLGSVAPDYVESALRLEHRSRWAHNVLTGALLLFLPAPLSPVAAAFGLGWLHHVLLDALTVHGVYAGRGMIRGPLRTDNAAHNLLVVALHALPLLLLR